MEPIDIDDRTPPWCDPFEPIEDMVLTALHGDNMQPGHRSGFCPQCAQNHLVAMKLAAAMWQFGWRPSERPVG